MQTTKKKPSLIFILVGAVLAGYLGYLINGAWTEGIAFNEFMDRFNEVCAVPFANYYNSNTVKAVAIALGIMRWLLSCIIPVSRTICPVRNWVRQDLKIRSRSTRYLQIRMRISTHTQPKCEDVAGF